MNIFAKNASKPNNVFKCQNKSYLMKLKPKKGNADFVDFDIKMINVKLYKFLKIISVNYLLITL